jgi:hypothetical protein
MLKYTHTKIACYMGYVVQAIACSFISLIFVILQETTLKRSVFILLFPTTVIISPMSIQEGL